MTHTIENVIQLMTYVENPERRARLGAIAIEYLKSSARRTPELCKNPTSDDKCMMMDNSMSYIKCPTCVLSKF